MIDELSLAGVTAAEKRAIKAMRKKVRAIMRADLQRRAITGEPSPFRRCAQPSRGKEG